ncbi:glutaredoxin family protein [Tessaracoccus sp. OH4464_COT-324]|uniref:glutaredoxin family protein n=1 Tax=Tessaracoccus sp. OH4464_COT-324 TaxID=2491059 RepID=UPI000F62E380|nr:glutaredoxin family protein [Tessaracoccus sp. OH4464_COT-324]RRD45819.1 glutaredoxin family protein [Tessaracoccus sp. OH4464_COT-324]
MTPCSAARVRLLTRSGCHLCSDAERIVERSCALRGVGYELVDVDSDSALAEYSDHVPVLIVDGKVRSFWFVDEAALSALL